MDNNLENIEPENQEIYNLIKKVADKEAFDRKINSIVANKIRSTDFTSLVNLVNTSGAFVGNGLYYLIGIIVVAGGLTYYYFSIKSEANQENNTIEKVTNNKESGIIVPNSNINDNIEMQYNETTKDIIDDKTIKNKKVSEELLTLETQDYQHIQTFKLNNEYDNEFLINSFIKIFEKLGFAYIDKSNNQNIILETKKYKGYFNNQIVNFRITLLYNLNEKNQIRAILNYNINNDIISTDLTVDDIFYDKLSNEIINIF
jgi:hypothetical protein